MASLRTLFPLSALLLVVGCTPDVPEAASPAARTYQNRCGVCHRAYAPATLTFPMWEMIVPRMDKYMAARGIVIPADERAEILGYLERNAAGK